MSDQDLVLIGGGHTHALVLRRLAMRPIENVRLTLISESAMTPYSGMLPGYVAGHYDFQQTHIDLNHLCRFSGVRWIEARADGLDLKHRRVLLKDRPAIEFDTLSIDIGSTSSLAAPGAKDFAIGVKPITVFDQHWRALLETSSTESVDWGVIGGGAAGVELVLAMAYRLRQHKHIKLHLVYRGQQILSGYPDASVAAAERSLKQYGVRCHSDFNVSQVFADGIKSDRGEYLALANSVWCAGAQAPSWLEEAGLSTDSSGFVTVNQNLQSVSHPTVFACGDIAHLRDDPRPKAGVYAVRQAPFLENNLRRFSQGRSLKPVKLQSSYLSLLSLGGRKATGGRYGIAVSGSWVWRLKDHIDQAFMRRLQNLGAPSPMSPVQMDKPHCAGCGGKLGPALLKNVLADLPLYSREDTVPALADAEDASVLNPPEGKQLVQSIDGFRAFSDDLYLVGQAATEHALNDVYAMGGEPLVAHVWASTGIHHPLLQQRDHQALMQGVAAALVQNQVSLAGGHSSEALDAAVGLAVTGSVDPLLKWSKGGLCVGDVLVLNKPLGTGVILAADMQAQAPAVSVRAALQSMCRSNRAAAEALAQAKPHGVTDVSGFGLLGHLREMLAKSNVSASLNTQAIPILPGALKLSSEGWRSSLFPALESELAQCKGVAECPKGLAELLLDPQTSGGLLAAIPVGEVQQLLLNHPNFVVIGKIEKPSIKSERLISLASSV